MAVHPEVLEIVNKTVLTNVIRIHDMNLPYAAELWVDGQREHEDGMVMFSISDRGYLTAEYFAYDNPMDPLERLGLGFKRLDAKLVMKDARVEVPIWDIRNSEKARTMYSHPMPAVKAYRCEMQGWMGDPASMMNSAHITLEGLPDIHLGSRTSRVPEEHTAVGNLTLQGFITQTGSLRLEAGDWEIQLTASDTSDHQERWPLHHALLSRKDHLPFTLEEDAYNGVINALRTFMSFQCRAWVDIPTIVCNPIFSIVEKNLTLRDGEENPDVISAVRAYSQSENTRWEAVDELSDVLRRAPGFEDIADGSLNGISVGAEHAWLSFSKGCPLVKRAWVGKLSQQTRSNNSQWTATDCDKWPELFRGFWEQYADEKRRKHLKNAVLHYVEYSRIFDEGAFHYGMVAAQATLQAVVRWWNDLPEDFQFGSGRGKRFNELLPEAVRQAGLGKDRGKEIDQTELSRMIGIATDYRNKIDHGQAGNFDGEIQCLVDCQMYYQNLARLLILAKFGSRDTDAGGHLIGPRFQDAHE